MVENAATECSLRRRSQVVRQRFAKPPFVSSILTGASEKPGRNSLLTTFATNAPAALANSPVDALVRTPAYREAPARGFVLTATANALRKWCLNARTRVWVAGTLCAHVAVVAVDRIALALVYVATTFDGIGLLYDDAPVVGAEVPVVTVLINTVERSTIDVIAFPRKPVAGAWLSNIPAIVMGATSRLGVAAILAADVSVVTVGTKLATAGLHVTCVIGARVAVVAVFILDALRPLIPTPDNTQRPNRDQH